MRSTGSTLGENSVPVKEYVPHRLTFHSRSAYHCGHCGTTVFSTIGVPAKTSPWVAAKVIRMKVSFFITESVRLKCELTIAGGSGRFPVLFGARTKDPGENGKYLDRL